MPRLKPCLALLALVFSLSIHTHAQTPADHTAILTVLNKSADDWNRGDLAAFATSYKNSPDILFMGRTMRRGYSQMLDGYKSGYSSPQQMGHLTFTALETQPLDEHFATVTGHYHLERTAAGGGNADGFFLLVMEHTPAGWKIVRDDTTALPPPAAKHP
jgi:ketosteroid isomerase-like protein